VRGKCTIILYSRSNTAYRKALFDKEVERIIKETSLEIEERYTIEMKAIGVDKDHIHHETAVPGHIPQCHIKNNKIRISFFRQG
jgi:REP element-mobilizing transposase RayT